MHDIFPQIKTFASASKDGAINWLAKEIALFCFAKNIGLIAVG